MNEPGDEARDPHLREALRHAPDAQLQAPSRLSEFILQEARAKARGPQHVGAPAPGWARRVWAWLARPAVATGFAGVMAATLVGLMWWDQPMDEALPRSPAPAAAPAVEKPAPAAPAVMASSPPPVVAAVPKPEPAPARKKSAEAPRGTPPVAAATADGRAAESAVAEAAAPPPAAATPAPAPGAAPPTMSADTSADAPLAQARAREEEHKRERSSMAPAEAQSRRAAAKAQLNESRLQREGEAYTRIASVRAAIASEPERWTWQRADAAAHPMNDAVDAWLAQLDTRTGTGWQAGGARDTTTAPRGRVLALLRDGQLQHSFQITEQGVLWQRGQAAWQIDLPAEVLAALQSALDSAAR